MKMMIKEAVECIIAISCSGVNSSSSLIHSLGMTEPCFFLHHVNVYVYELLK